MKKCNNCGKRFEDKFNFCTVCGNPIKIESSAIMNRFPKKWFVLLVLSLVLVLVIVVYIFNENRKFNETRQAIQDYKTDKMINEYLTSPKTSDLKIEDGWTWERDGNYIYIRGSVKNISDNTISYFKLEADFLDSSGNVIDSDWTNDGNVIKPNTSRKFSLMHKNDINFKKVRLSIGEVR